jgi:hypothetical protein
MSFIRCLNNPDHAYIYEHANGNVCIHSKEINKKLNFGRYEIPRDIFYGLVKKFIKNYNEHCSYKGFSIKECDKYSKYLFIYGNKKFKLWQVTWHYVVNNVEWRFLSQGERNRRIKIIEKL